jgi:hypothetical protein
MEVALEAIRVEEVRLIGRIVDAEWVELAEASDALEVDLRLTYADGSDVVVAVDVVDEEQREVG